MANRSVQSLVLLSPEEIAPACAAARKHIAATLPEEEREAVLAALGLIPYTGHRYTRNGPDSPGEPHQRMPLDYAGSMA